jgi:hypothetical protein
LLKFIMLELLLKADPPMVALLLTSVLALIVAIAFGPTDYLGDMAKLQAPTVLSETLIVSASARAGAANLLDEAARLRAQVHSLTSSSGDGNVRKKVEQS